MEEHSVELLQQLTEADGVPGHEGEVRAIFEQRLSFVGDVRRDPLGNVLCIRRGSREAPRIMLDCHLDEVGFLVQSITPQGFLKFVNLGGWWSHTLPSQRVRVITEHGKLPGIIGATPPHLLSSESRDKLLKIEDLYIDIGATNREQAFEFGVRPGCAVAPDVPFRRLHNEQILSAKAFDNRVGVALVIEALERVQEHPNTLYGVGSVQEEVGIRGATVSIRSVDPDLALVLEGPPADDTPGMDAESAQGKLGGGVQIRLYDPSMIAHPKLAAWVLRTAEEYSIPHQVAVRRSGGTDGRAIHLHQHGVPTVVLGVPARYIHSHVSLIHVGDYQAALQLLLRILPALDEGLVRSLKNA